MLYASLVPFVIPHAVPTAEARAGALRAGGEGGWRTLAAFTHPHTLPAFCAFRAQALRVGVPLSSDGSVGWWTLVWNGSLMSPPRGLFFNAPLVVRVHASYTRINAFICMLPFAHSNRTADLPRLVFPPHDTTILHLHHRAFIYTYACTPTLFYRGYLRFPDHPPVNVTSILPIPRSTYGLLVARLSPDPPLTCSTIPVVRFIPRLTSDCPFRTRYVDIDYACHYAGGTRERLLITKGR